MDTRIVEKISEISETIDPTDEELRKMMESGVFPPPIHISSTDDISSDIQGIIQNENGNLVKNYFSYNKLGNFLVNIYDEWIHYRLQYQLENLKVRFEDGSEIFFSDLVKYKPSLNEKMSDQESPIMLPQTARNAGLTYNMDLRARAFFRDTNGIVYDLLNSNHIHIGKIPVMLSSSMCHLYNMSDDSLRAVGEDPSSCLGFFIVEGIEYVIIIREKMRTTRCYCSNIKVL
jgi:DNA-directed RNA polymerase beta subunit